MTHEEKEAIRERCNKATPGPWEWDIRTGRAVQVIQLLTSHSGRYTIMDFIRWGTQGASPRFQEYERYEGPVNDRGSKGMARADKFAKSFPGYEHHKGFDDYVDHPDAEFIAHAASDIPALLDALDKAESRIEALERAMKDGRTRCEMCIYFEKSIAFDHIIVECRGCIGKGGCYKNWQFDEARFSKHGGQE